MADVKCDKLKPAAKAMFDKATKADGRVKNLETWAGTEVEKETWAAIKQEVQNSLNASAKLNKFADAKKEDGLEQAGKDLTVRWRRLAKPCASATPLKPKAKADSEEAGELSALLSALGQVTTKEKPARDALGLPEKRGSAGRSGGPEADGDEARRETRRPRSDEAVSGHTASRRCSRGSLASGWRGGDTGQRDREGR